MITRKGFTRLLIIAALLSASLLHFQIPLVYAPTAFTHVDSLDLYDPINEARVSVVNGTDLYVGTDDDYSNIRLVKIDLNTFTTTANITLVTDHYARCYDLLVDAAGEYLYAGLFDYPATIVKVNLTTFEVDSSLTLNSGENIITDQVIVGNYLYATLRTSPASVAKIDLTTFTRVDILSLAADEVLGYHILYNGTGELIYVVTGSADSNPTYAAGRVVRVNITDFTRKDRIALANANEAYPNGAAIDSGYLYVATTDALSPWVASRIIRIALSTFTRVSHISNDISTFYDLTTNGTHGFVLFGTSVHWIRRFTLSSFTWTDAAIRLSHSLAWNTLVIHDKYLYCPYDTTPSIIYKLNLSTWTVDDSLTLYSGIQADIIIGLESDTTYLYALCQMESGASKIAKVDLATFEVVTTQALGATEDEAAAIELYNGYLYVSCDNGTEAKILKIDASTLATVDTAIIWGDSNTILSLHVAEDGYLYAGADWKALHKIDPSNLNFISNMTLEDDEDDPYALASDGTYLYVVIEANYITHIAQIELASFTRVDTLVINEYYPRSCDYADGYLYVTYWAYPKAVSKIDVATMTDVDYELLPVDENYGYGLTVFLGNVYVGTNEDGYPEGGTVVQLETSTLDRVASITLNYSNKELEIGALEIAAVGNDVYLFVGTYESAPAVIARIYLTSTVTCTFASNPEIAATFTIEGTEYTTPDTLTPYIGVNTLIATEEVEYEEVTYVFDSWLVNGTTSYYLSTINLDLTGDTSLVLNYVVKGNPPVIPPLYDPTDPNMTLYMRSDTHTVEETLGYKLLIQQSTTSTYDVRSIASNNSVSYGSRVWVIDSGGYVFELTSGEPVGIVTRNDNSSSLLLGTWTCGDYTDYITDILMIKVYQRFGTDDWSLRRTFISDVEMLIRIPSSTWSFYYHVDQYFNGVTNSTFSHGSSAYNSRVIFWYAAISPWEVMTYHFVEFNLLAALFTPWTFHIGDMFWGIMLMFILVTTYNRYGSLRAVLGMSWLFAGSGGLLSFVIPQVGLEISWLFLAFTLAITLYKLIR